MAESMSLAENTNGASDQERKWYVIHTYSGYENKVKTNLEHRIESMGVQDKIFQVVIPTEEEIEIKDGQRRTVQKKVYPGYVMVEMAMDDDAWYVVRNTKGERVKVVDGPFTAFIGVVDDINPEKGKVRVLVSFFGRETPVELDFLQVQRIV